MRANDIILIIVGLSPPPVILSSSENHLADCHHLPSCSRIHHHRLRIRSAHQRPIDHVRTLLSIFLSFSPAYFFTVSVISLVTSYVQVQRTIVTSVLSTSHRIQHAFWLIYKRIQAEKKYGPHGYKCAHIQSSLLLGFDVLTHRRRR